MSMQDDNNSNPSAAEHQYAHEIVDRCLTSTHNTAWCLESITARYQEKYSLAQQRVLGRMARLGGVLEQCAVNHEINKGNGGRVHWQDLKAAPGPVPLEQGEVGLCLGSSDSNVVSAALLGRDFVEVMKVDREGLFDHQVAINTAENVGGWKAVHGETAIAGPIGETLQQMARVSSEPLQFIEESEVDVNPSAKLKDYFSQSMSQSHVTRLTDGATLVEMVRPDVLSTDVALRVCTGDPSPSRFRRWKNLFRSALWLRPKYLNFKAPITGVVGSDGTWSPTAGFFPQPVPPLVGTNQDGQPDAHVVA